MNVIGKKNRSGGLSTAACLAKSYISSSKRNGPRCKRPEGLGTVEFRGRTWHDAGPAADHVLGRIITVAVPLSSRFLALFRIRVRFSTQTVQETTPPPAFFSGRPRRPCRRCPS